MKTQEYTDRGGKEVVILSAMAWDPQVLGRVAGLAEPPFSSPAANIVAGLMTDYWKASGKPPKKLLDGLAAAWAEKNAHHAALPLVEQLLTAVKDRHRANGDTPAEYVLDLAGEYFSAVRARKAIEAAQTHLDSGRVPEALQSLARAEPVAVGQGTAGVHLLTDPEAVKAAFAQPGESIIPYKGGLQRFFGDALQRDSFVSFMAPEGVGKTWWLIDLAWRAMRAGLRVAFYEVGDMSQNQIVRRFLVRAAGRPWKEGTVRYPKKLEPFRVTEHEDRKYDQPLGRKAAWSACERVMKSMGASQSRLYLETHPNTSCTVSGVRASLANLERSGWVPDVVVIDYADILAPPPGVREERQQINENWKHLRRVSQELHCLVVTATQSRRDSYDGNLLRKKHMSDDKRKLAHVTGMVGINQTNEDKRNGVYRLNWLKAREMEFNEEQCVHTASCLAVCNPAVLSIFPRGDEVKAALDKRREEKGGND